MDWLLNWLRLIEWTDVFVYLVAAIISVAGIIFVIRLVEYVLGVTFSVATFLTGLIIYVLIWALFVVSTLFWVPFMFLVNALTFLLGASFTKISPRGRRFWKLHRAAGHEKGRMFAALEKCLEKEDLVYDSYPKRKQPLYALDVGPVSEAHHAVLKLGNRLELGEDARQSAAIFTEYLNAIIELQKGVLGLKVTLPKWEYYLFETCQPHNYLRRESKDLNSPKELFHNFGAGLRFLFRYILFLPFWCVYYPFVLAPITFANSQIWPYRKAIKRVDGRLQNMKTLLLKHRNSIEKLIEKFASFQDEQASIHQQTKTLRDELAEELASVRQMVTQHRDEVARVRQYVGLVKERSDKMDATDPLTEMRSLLSEIKDSRS